MLNKTILNDQFWYEFKNDYKGNFIACPILGLIDKPEWDEVCPGCMNRKRECTCHRFRDGNEL